MRYRQDKERVYCCQYHVAFFPKYRRKVLGGEIGSFLKTEIERVCRENDIELLETEVLPDLVYLFIKLDPSEPVHLAIKKVKAETTKSLRSHFPELKSKLPTLWTNAYFVSTGDEKPMEAIRAFADSQETSQRKAKKGENMFSNIFKKKTDETVNVDMNLQNTEDPGSVNNTSENLSRSNINDLMASDEFDPDKARVIAEMFLEDAKDVGFWADYAINVLQSFLLAINEENEIVRMVCSGKEIDYSVSDDPETGYGTIKRLDLWLNPSNEDMLSGLTKTVEKIQAVPNMKHPSKTGWKAFTALKNEQLQKSILLNIRVAVFGKDEVS